jgi:hypothetical protein
MPNGNLTDETIALMEMVKADLAKATYQTSTGLTQYDLEQTAYNVYPILSPLRNQTPRVKSDRGDTATRWNAVTAIDTTTEFPGVSEGQRTSSIGVTVTPFTAAYETLGHEASTTFEAEEAAESYADARANAAMAALQTLIQNEDKIILGGNNSYALGTPATPVLTPSASGGSLPTMTLSVIVVALTLDGNRRSSVSGGVATTITRNNNDGTTTSGIKAGSSAKSSNQTASITGATGSCLATVTAKAGVMAWAWYWGVAGSELLGAITTVNTVTITAAATGTQNASAITADNSNNALVFDGLITLASKTGNNGYFASLGGAGFTSDTASGIVEIDVMLQSFYDNYRLGPTKLWISSQEARNINKKVIGNGGAPLIRFAMDNAGGQAFTRLIAGTAIGQYFNKFTGELIDMQVEPFLTAGTLLAVASKLPYAVPNVPAEAFRIKARREYYGMDWPVTTRTYFHGAYVTEVLQHYATFSLGLIQNIGNS